MSKGLFGQGPVAGQRAGGGAGGREGPHLPAPGAVTRRTARMEMLCRPYPRPTSTGARGFYWLVRHYVENKPPVVIDRGEGQAAKDRIERYVRTLAAGSATDSRLAAQCWIAGWQARR